jgi:hypothetical protein
MKSMSCTLAKNEAPWKTQRERKTKPDLGHRAAQKLDQDYA